MKRRFRYNEKTREMEEVTDGAAKYTGGVIIPDIEPFVSPVDGTVISSRVHRDAYMREKGLAFTDDYNKPGGFWERKQKERADYFAGRTNPDSHNRKSQMSDAFEHLRNQQRSKNGR